MVPLIAAAIPALVQGGIGIAQSVQAGKQRKALEGMSVVPESATRALEIQQALANQSRMPGATIMEDRIRTSTGEGINAIKEIGASGASKLGAVADLYGNQNQAFQELEMQNANWQFGNQQGLVNQLNKVGEFENMERMSTAAAASAMQNAGMQNIFGGADNLGASVVSASSSNSLLNNANNPMTAGDEGPGIPWEGMSDEAKANSYNQLMAMIKV